MSVSDENDEARVVKSVARTLEILEFFDEVQEPVNVIHVSKALGYPQSSTSALLRSMVTLGYLKFDRHKRTYQPTDRVALLGSWMNPTLFAEASLQRLLKSVADRSGHTVLLGARNGDHAQYIHVFNSRKYPLHHIKLGTKRSLAYSGVGKVLLSAMDDAEVKRIFHRVNAYRSEGEEPVDVRALVASLAEVRNQGYFISTNRVVQGSGLIAKLIPSECTDRPLAIGLGAPTEKILERKDELLAIMHEEMKRFFGKYMHEQTKPSAANLNRQSGASRTTQRPEEPYVSIFLTK